MTDHSGNLEQKLTSKLGDGELKELGLVRLGKDEDGLHRWEGPDGKTYRLEKHTKGGYSLPHHAYSN